MSAIHKFNLTVGPDGFIDVPPVSGFEEGQVVTVVVTNDLTLDVRTADRLPDTVEEFMALVESIRGRPWGSEKPAQEGEMPVPKYY